MRAGSICVLCIGVAVLATNAGAAYTVNSRFSEFKRDNYDNMYPTVDEVYSTSGTEELYVSGTPVRHRSNLNAGGATYEAYVQTEQWSGPPSGTNLYGHIDSSRFDLIFTITEATNFTLTGSLQRYWTSAGTSTLKLEGLSGGTSPTLQAVATGGFDNNFAPNLVNWSGTLLAGQYKLSISETAGNWAAGFGGQYTKSSFTFSIPTPGTAGLLLALAALPIRRRRN
jgi:hypothetical protein